MPYTGAERSRIKSRAHVEMGTPAAPPRLSFRHEKDGTPLAFPAFHFHAPGVEVLNDPHHLEELARIIVAAGPLEVHALAHRTAPGQHREASVSLMTTPRCPSGTFEGSSQRPSFSLAPMVRKKSYSPTPT